MHTQIEVPKELQFYYNGTMDCEIFELVEPGPPNSTTLIRTSQDWQIIVKWWMRGMPTWWPDCEYHVNVVLEHFGVDVPGGPEDHDFPPVVVLDSAGTSVVGGVDYHADIDIAHGTIPAGVYKVVTLLQGFGNLPTDPAGTPPRPNGVAGLCEGPIISVYEM